MPGSCASLASTAGLPSMTCSAGRSDAACRSGGACDTGISKCSDKASQGQQLWHPSLPAAGQAVRVCAPGTRAGSRSACRQPPRCAVAAGLPGHCQEGALLQFDPSWVLLVPDLLHLPPWLHSRTPSSHTSRTHAAPPETCSHSHVADSPQGSPVLVRQPRGGSGAWLRVQRQQQELSGLAEAHGSSPSASFCS